MKSITILLTTLFVLSACAGGKSCASSAPKTLPDAIVLNNYAEPPTLDPALATDETSMIIIHQLFEGLTEYDPKTVMPIPAVATRWEVSSDGLTYTFYLRDHTTWSDGSPVTAADFEYSWKRTLNPATASGSAYLLYFIRNAEEYNNGTLADASTVGVRAVSPTTLEVTLKDPAPFFPQLTSHSVCRPVHRATVEQWGDQWTRPEHMISNGPYRFTSWVPQKEIVMEKNPNYWDKETVKIAKAIFLPTNDQETALKQQLEGKVHVSHNLPVSKLTELAKRPDLHNVAHFANYYYMFNTQKKPFDDARVRRAFSLAIDREQLVKTLNRGDIPATAFIPPVEGYAPPAVEMFNPQKAKELLKEAGYADLSTFPPVTVLYNTNDLHRTVSEILQGMWKQHLGIQVSLQNQEWKVVIDSWKVGNFELTRSGWFGDYFDPHAFLAINTTNSQQNHMKWSNPQFDDFVNVQSQKELDPAQRMAILKQAEEILLSDMPVIPLFYYGRPILVDPRLKGFYPNAGELHPLKFAWFEENK
ncbi:MAG: peptide ABC transporter substrate-binding protein [Deltaproteobacteria bacterium]|nr:peptide ABC transporter substrate-binding protein [Deltaproteobacteria bacterium]